MEEINLMLTAIHPGREDCFGGDRRDFEKALEKYQQPLCSMWGLNCVRVGAEVVVMVHDVNVTFPVNGSQRNHYAPRSTEWLLCRLWYRVT